MYFNKKLHTFSRFATLRAISNLFIFFLYTLYTALFHLKHRFYVEILILFGDQHSKGHSALTIWNTMAQAEQNRYRNNWSKLLFQGMQEDAETASTDISNILEGEESITLLLRLFKDNWFILHA